MAKDKEPEEGVIKYQLDYTETEALDPLFIKIINAWRRQLFLMGLIGQDSERYGGYGYGNISYRIANNQFIISGSQTGHLPVLDNSHYALIMEHSIAENKIVAQGPIKPSSESLTHAMLYELDSDIQYIMHTHSPIIWHKMAAMDIPFTDKDVPYGTPAMAEEVKRLFKESEVKALKIFGMAGHEDGIISFGESAEEAGQIMLHYLEKAKANY